MRLKRSECTILHLSLGRRDWPWLFKFVPRLIFQFCRSVAYQSGTGLPDIARGYAAGETSAVISRLSRLSAISQPNYHTDKEQLRIDLLFPYPPNGLTLASLNRGSWFKRIAALSQVQNRVSGVFSMAALGGLSC
jgi:hypothetical protein